MNSDDELGDDLEVHFLYWRSEWDGEYEFSNMLANGLELREQMHQQTKHAFGDEMAQATRASGRAEILETVVVPSVFFQLNVWIDARWFAPDDILSKRQAREETFDWMFLSQKVVGPVVLMQTVRP